MTQATAPRSDEIWRARNGATRTIISADTEGYWVIYRRPPPAPIDAVTVSGRKWKEWVEREGATRIKKAWRAS